MGASLSQHADGRRALPPAVHNLRIVLDPDESVDIPYQVTPPVEKIFDLAALGIQPRIPDVTPETATPEL